MVYEDESLRTAADRMVLAGVGRLPVIGRGRPTHPVGIITRSDILAAHLGRIDAARKPVRSLGGGIPGVARASGARAAPQALTTPWFPALSPGEPPGQLEHEELTRQDAQELGREDGVDGGDLSLRRAAAERPEQGSPFFSRTSESRPFSWWSLAWSVPTSISSRPWGHPTEETASYPSLPRRAESLGRSSLAFSSRLSSHSPGWQMRRISRWAPSSS